MKTETKTRIVIAIILMVIIYLIFRINFTQAQAIDKYTYTRAICSDTNFCQDHIVVCENSELVELTPITGAAVQFDSDWEDPRTNLSDNFCE